MLRELGRERIYIRSSKAALLTLVVVVSSLSFSGEIASAPPISGNWVVFGQESYSNTTVVLNGSLIITETGKLTLDNVTLIVNSTYHGEHGIRVNQTGVFVVNNSWIESYDPDFTYSFEVYGSLFFNYSTAENLYGLPSGITKGGIQVYGGNLTMYHSNVTKSRGDGIHLVQASATLSNCEVSNNGAQELYLYRSHYVNVTSCKFLESTLELGYGVVVDNSDNFSIQDSEIIGHRGFGLLVMNSQGFTMNNSYVAGSVDTGGVYITHSNSSVISNSTLYDNFGVGIRVKSSRDVLIHSNQFIDNGGGIGMRDSHGLLINNTAPRNDGGTISLINSNATLIGNSDQDPSGVSLTSVFSNVTFKGDSFSEVLFFSNSTAEAIGIVIPYLNSESSDILLVNSTVYSSSPFDIWWGSHVTLLNTTVPKWEYFSVDCARLNPSDPSSIVVKNFLDIRTVDETGDPLEGVDILVEDNGKKLYASPGFGGTDPLSNADGESNWIIATDRIYLNDFKAPGHPFLNITYNTTTVFVSKSEHKFDDNPREVEMAQSHLEVFHAVPPAPPTNLTAFLSGAQNENISLQWNVSIDDSGGANIVENYYVFRGSNYDRSANSYQLVATVPNGTFEFVDSGKGVNDPSNYFYLVCSVSSRNVSDCSPNQAGKFSRNLTAGVQIVSVPLIPTSWNLSEVFKTIEYDKVWTYSNGEEDPWRSFHRGKIANDLSELNRSMGIWINVTTEDVLVVAGIVPIETRIALHPGWNLVGFPSFNETYSISDLVLQTGAISVEGYGPLASPYFLRKLGDGETLNAGEAYWIRVPGEALWIITN